MPEISLFEWVNILVRWVHVAAAILWVGLLYFFNFVNAPTAKTYDAETRKKVVPEMMPRALFFFRWAAMITFLAGWVLFYVNYLAPGAPAQAASGRGVWIMTGMTFGTIMWFNVWFIIWPIQRKIIRGLRGGAAVPPETAAWALTASKINVYLSVPLVFCMLAGAGHFPYATWYLVGGVVLLGFAVAAHLFMIAGKIKTEV